MPENNFRNGHSNPSPSIVRNTDTIMRIIEAERAKAIAQAAPALAETRHRLEKTEQLVQQLLQQRDAALAEAQKSQIQTQANSDASLRASVDRFCASLRAELGTENARPSVITSNNISNSIGDYSNIFDELLCLVRERLGGTPGAPNPVGSGDPPTQEVNQ